MTEKIHMINVRCASGTRLFVHNPKKSNQFSDVIYHDPDSHHF